MTRNGKPARRKRRTFTAAYKARILAAFDALPEGCPESCALLRIERLYPFVTCRSGGGSRPPVP